MHIDLKVHQLDNLTAEVAVVGTGAAGQAIARALANAGHAILMLESGGFDFDRVSADLNAGQCVGQPYYDLEEARLRMFGGTTAIWGGRCAELSEIDFRKRPWVPGSGWPFGLDALRHHYDRAWRMLEMPAPEIAEFVPPPLHAFVGGQLVPCVWRIDRATERFGAARNGDLLRHASVTVVTHATVREILPAEDGRSIDHLDVRGPSGEQVIVTAKHFVIAAGGIENARLLLVSDSLGRCGLGNDRDLVGRFFMEHPHGRGGRIIGPTIWRLMRSFQKRSAIGHDEAWLLAGSPALQEATGALNGAITLAVRRPAGKPQFLIEQAYRGAKLNVAPTERGRALWHAYRRLGRSFRTTLAPAAQWQRLHSGRAELAIVLRAEQSPNPDSRLRLLHDTDALGMRRVELDWRLQRQDKESAIALIQALDAELRRLNLGEVEPSEWLSDEREIWRSDPNVSVHPFGGFHHIGTTRMAEEPKRGVTDGWGRVHGIENLYLAGSSLFPTSGWANPTLTILALSLRTADRLISVINKPKPVLRPVLPLPAEVDAPVEKPGTVVRAA